MSNRSHKLPALLGRSLLASIGEPWDFTSAAGDNLLKGKVVETSDSDEATAWILCEVSPFTEGERVISQVVAVRRYEGDDLIERLGSSEPVGVNLLYAPDGSKLNPRRVRRVLEEQRGLKFLAGSIQLVT